MARRSDDTNDGGVGLDEIARRFMSEFNENSTIFMQAILPIMNQAATAIPLIDENRGRINFLSSTLGRQRNQIRDLENRVANLEIEESTTSRTSSILDNEDRARCLEDPANC